MKRLIGLAWVFCACGAPAVTVVPDAAAPDGGVVTASLPLVDTSDPPLPGGATRFDYQDIDPAQGHLIVAHMNDGNVIVANLSDGSVVKVIPNVPTARGIVVADDVGLFFVTSTPNQLVEIDNTTLAEVRRVTTGTAPDGVGWDPNDKIVGVSDQGDGAISLISNAGSGPRTQVPLGSETGNVVYDAPRGIFWITVVGPTSPDQLVGIDPVAAQKTTSIPLPGCDGAHGLRIHPDGQSAFIACENNDKLARVDLGGSNAISIASTGSGPDVLSIDPGIGWLYVAAESDPATHRVFFPLMNGGSGTPVLRVMKPTGL